MDRGLADEACEACRPGAPRVSTEDMPALLAAVPRWHRTERNGTDHVRRSYRFPDFALALAFTARVGALAEAEDHHPTITLQRGQATVTWWTYAIGGLHRNDFRMAARCDVIYAEITRASTPAGEGSPAGVDVVADGRTGAHS